MTANVFYSVLSFAEGIIRWRIIDLCSRLFRVFIVTVNVIYVYQEGRNTRLFTFDDDDRALTKGELEAVVSDSESLLESKRLAEPGRGCTYIIVGKFWNNYAGWHGAVCVYCCFSYKLFNSNR